MQSDTFKERVNRLKEVNEVIEKLDPSIRATAFSLLSDYVTGHATKEKPGAGKHSADDEITHTDGAELFAKHPDGRPSENVNLIAAYLYSEYGAQPFTLADIRSKADAVGITVPASLDMTLKQASRKGKALFQHTGRNEYKPTVNGELYFKNTYKVKKGTKPRPAAGNEP